MDRLLLEKRWTRAIEASLENLKATLEAPGAGDDGGSDPVARKGRRGP